MSAELPQLAASAALVVVHPLVVAAIALALRGRVGPGGVRGFAVLSVLAAVLLAWRGADAAIGLVPPRPLGEPGGLGLDLRTWTYHAGAALGALIGVVATPFVTAALATRSSSPS